MALKLSTLREETTTAQVVYDGEPVDFAYYPGRLTGETLDALDQAQIAGQFSSLYDNLAPVLSWVDVLNDDGERIPPTTENMKGWPINFALSLMTKMAEEIRPPASRS